MPRVSSERRDNIPIGFITGDGVASDAMMVAPNATLYHFGILTSTMSMAWTRLVCGRLKSDYRYSGGIVYNNFSWPEPIEEQKSAAFLFERYAELTADARRLTSVPSAVILKCCL